MSGAMYAMTVVPELNTLGKQMVLKDKMVSHSRL